MRGALENGRQRLKESLTLSEKRGDFEVFAQAQWMGEDLLVELWGGVAHIGAVAAAQPRPSLRDSQVTSATSSVFTFLGHKEDAPAKALSEALSSRLKKKVVVVAGIHWDNARPEDLQQIMGACEALTEALVERLKTAV
ncbi:MAG TPA: hypothetical protein VLW86_06095 [Syntrophorhabdales bacterium]|nr:hypothetical protein [Syntrophorhabdales bacterium]